MSEWDDLPVWQRDPLGQRLVLADGELADHVASCAACRSGRGCPGGDDTAEAEYRAFDHYREVYPDDARTYRDEQIAAWPPG